MGFILVTVDELVDDLDNAVEVVEKRVFWPDFNKKYSDLLYVTVSFI